MSTENDFRPTWDAERIADIRERLRAEHGWHDATILSLLDELERVRQERDVLREDLHAVLGWTVEYREEWEAQAKAKNPVGMERWRAIGNAEATLAGDWK